MKKLFALVLLMSFGAVQSSEIEAVEWNINTHQAFLDAYDQAYNIIKESANIAVSDNTTINTMCDNLTEIINNNPEVLDYRHEETKNNLNLVQFAYFINANTFI